MELNVDTKRLPPAQETTWTRELKQNNWYAPQVQIVEFYNWLNAAIVAKAPNQIRSIFQKYKPKLINTNFLQLNCKLCVSPTRNPDSSIVCQFLVDFNLKSCVIGRGRSQSCSARHPYQQDENAREANRKRPQCLYPNRKRPPNSFPRRAGKYVQLDNFRHYKPTSKCYHEEIIAGTGNIEQLPDQY